MEEKLYPEIETTTIEEFYKTLSILATVEHSYLSAKVLAKAFTPIEETDNVVVEIIMNAKSYSEIRLWGRETIIDPVCKKDVLEKGIMCYIWGAQIVVTRKAKDNEILVLSGNEMRKAVIIKLDGELNMQKELMDEIISTKQMMQQLFGKISRLENLANDLTIKVTKHV